MRFSRQPYDGGFGEKSVYAVFADIRQRATDLLLAELREAGVAAEVGAEMDRILRRLLTSVERIFAEP